MYRAMIIKELRETRAVTIGAVILYGLFLMERRHMLEYPNDTIPFINNAFFSTFIFYAGLMAGSLGAWQTFGESVRKTYPFLLHHPATPNWLIGMKLVVGMGVYLFVTAIPIVICALWAATPGTYASPFEWWMTAPVWVCWFAMITIYLATFLSGIMPGPWYGARFLPMAASAAVLYPLLVFNALYDMTWFLGGILLVVDIWIVVLILFVANTRDYS